MGHACTSDTFGSGGHSYGHFVDSEELFQLTPGDYVHKELTRKICGLADPRLDRAVRASLMGVACGSVQLPERFQAFVKAVLGRQVTRQDMEKYLQLPPATNRGIMELRGECTGILLASLDRLATALPRAWSHDETCVRHVASP